MNEKRSIHIWKIMANLNKGNYLFKWWIFVTLAIALTLPRLWTDTQIWPPSAWTKVCVPEPSAYLRVACLACSNRSWYVLFSTTVHYLFKGAGKMKPSMSHNYRKWETCNIFKKFKLFFYTINGLLYFVKRNETK